MKRMSKALTILVATILVGAGFATRAEATAITLDNVIVSATEVNADLVVSALNEASGGFSAQITYSAADFTGATYLLDPSGKFSDGTPPNLDLSFGFGGGVLDLFLLAGFTPAELVVAQGPFPTAFALAHVTFTRSSPTAGTLLGLANLTLSNADGSGIIPLNAPEPASMLLVGAGLAGLVARRKLSRARQ